MKSTAVLAALFIAQGCSADEAPKSQFGRLNKVTLASWAGACVGQLAPQRVCIRPVGNADFERFPWTPDCRADDTQERLHCSGAREWDLWLDREQEWVMAVCVHGPDDLGALKIASKLFGQVMSRERRDRAIGFALAPEHNRNLLSYDPEVGTVSLCWRWEEP